MVHGYVQRYQKAGNGMIFKNGIIFLLALFFLKLHRQYPLHHGAHWAYTLFVKTNSSFVFADYANILQKDEKVQRQSDYKKLWKLLIDHNMTKTKLKEKTVSNSSTLEKLGKDESVTTAVLLRICEVLNCNIDDIVTGDPYFGNKSD